MKTKVSYALLAVTLALATLTIAQETSGAAVSPALGSGTPGYVARWTTGSNLAPERIYACKLNSDVRLTPPYDVAYCYDGSGQIVWMVGFTPKNGMMYVFPKVGTPWYASVRPEHLSACDKTGHCFVLKISPGTSPAHMHVDFLGTVWH
jgi:hypothetical protein